MQNLNSLIEKIKNTKDPFEKSKIILSIVKEKKTGINQLAKALGVTPSYLSHLIRLNKLPEMLVDGYYAGSITLSHLFVISRLKEKNDMIKLYEKVLKDNLSVKETEMEVRNILHKIKTEGKYFPSEDLKEIEAKIKKILGDKIEVKIIQSRIKLKIYIQAKGSLKMTGELLKKISKLLEDILKKGSANS